MKDSILRNARFKRFCLLFSTLFLLMFLPVTASADWTIEAVDAPAYFTNFYHRAIAIDKVTNQPHIAYGGDHLYHAYFDGTEWQYEIADDSPGVGQYASIAIDSNNKIHISYYDATNLDLKYAKNASGSWVTYTVDSAGSVGQYTSIAVDSNNKVHINYFNGTLKYATNASGAWVTSTIDSTWNVGQYTSIAVDSNNKVHISYYDYTNRDLKYATNASGSWVKSTIDSTGSVGYYTSIALDTNNKVHISYYDNTNYDLKYATNASGSWVTSTIDSTGDVGQYTSIAIDSNHNVHISYCDYTNTDLKYATNASGAWVTSTIDFTDDVGWSTSIAIDLNHNVHISYYDYTNMDLKYATNASGAWVTSTIDSTGNVGQDTSIAVDSNNKVHISYSDETNRDLKYATNVSGAWVTSTIDSTGLVGENTSIAVDSNNKVHISYRNGTNLDLKYATNASGAWVTSTIDSTGDVGEYTSIAIDSGNKVHISYYDYTNLDLKYATNASGAWVTSTIDSTGKVGQYTSITIDSNHNVHISYRDYTNTDLKYATNASGAWVTSTIDSTGDVGVHTSIAIDSGNKVHISYCDYTNIDLKYATNASGAWITSTIDSTGNVGSSTSIAIDSGNKVHISYYDGTNKDLKYATNAPYNSPFTDDDGDGYSEVQGDCNDADASINPVAAELCDNIDNNCNGQIDEGLPLNTYYLDADGDGYGNPVIPVQECSQPSGYVVDNTDCKDSNAAINPGATEICDLVDNNCDGQTDEGFPLNIYYHDGDGDAYGNPANSTQQCMQPAGYVTDNTDCNDSNSVVNPGAAEICDGIDNNCNGNVDEGFVDADADGYAICRGDCDDNDAAVNPGATEILYNSKDDDCKDYTPDYTWKSETVDSGGNYSSIAVDAENKIHISYYAAGLKYATNASGSWVTSTVDSGATLNFPDFTSIAVDSVGKVHISYFDETNWVLKYATNVSGVWETAALYSYSGGVYSGSSIAVDSSDKVHISFSSASGSGHLMYATNTSGAWAIQDITDLTSGFPLSGNTSISTDSLNRIHIIHFYSTAIGGSPPSFNSYIYHSSTDALGSWSTEITIYGYGEYINNVSSALDSQNNLHISYQGTYELAGAFIKYDGNVVAWCSGNTSIAVGLSNSAHIFACSGAQYFISQDAAGWLPYGVTSGASISNRSIAIDALGYLHVIYSKNGLVYATTAPDIDGDGYAANVDCNDNDPLEHPGQTWYLDADDDGYSDGTTNTASCTRPAEYKVSSELMATSGDSNDNDPNIYPKVRDTEDGSTYYSTLQEAYDAANSGDSIQSETTNFTEDLIIDLDKSVTLQGGYNSGYTSVTGKTTLNGSLTISNGTVFIGDFILQ